MVGAVFPALDTHPGFADGDKILLQFMGMVCTEERIRLDLAARSHPCFSVQNDSTGDEELNGWNSCATFSTANGSSRDRRSQDSPKCWSSNSSVLFKECGLDRTDPFKIKDLSQSNLLGRKQGREIYNSGIRP